VPGTPGAFADHRQRTQKRISISGICGDPTPTDHGLRPTRARKRRSQDLEHGAEFIVRHTRRLNQSQGLADSPIELSVPVEIGLRDAPNLETRRCVDVSGAGGVRISGK
jgi:hypothetical protein